MEDIGELRGCPDDARRAMNKETGQEPNAENHRIAAALRKRYRKIANDRWPNGWPRKNLPMVAATIYRRITAEEGKKSTLRENDRPIKVPSATTILRYLRETR